MSKQDIINSINAELRAARDAVFAVEVKAAAIVAELPAEWRLLVELNRSKPWVGYVGCLVLGLVVGAVSVAFAR